MFSDIPIRFWILLFLLISAIDPIYFVYRRLTLNSAGNEDGDEHGGDADRPSRAQLYRNLAVLALLATAAVYIFTPYAERFAQSKQFRPNLLLAFGVFAIFSIYTGVKNGEITPLVRGAGTYDRNYQPIRFWASVVWNLVFGCLVGWSGWQGQSHIVRDECFFVESREEALIALPLCNDLLEETFTQADRATILAARGIVHYHLQRTAKSIRDYSASLELDPGNTYTLNNRALAYEALGEYDRAIADYSMASRINPSNFDALYGRGKIRLDNREFDLAIADLTQALRLKPDDVLAIANRAIAFAWSDRRLDALADQQQLRAISPKHIAIPRISTILAYRERDTSTAIRHLSEAIALDPSDRWSLKLRADLYWDIGDLDRARDDDDRIMALKEAEGSWKTD